MNGVTKHSMTENGDALPSSLGLREKRKEGWSVPSSMESKGAINNVRLSEEKYFKDVLEKRDQSKELIKLSIGL